MKITNKHNLPQTIVNVLERPTYSKGKAQISATEMLNSPRIVQLKHKHWESLEQDASEMVWSLFGSAVHGVLEHGRDIHHVVEQRMYAEVKGWTISGAVDLQEVEEDGIIISDYKVTSAWSVMNEKEDWHRQLNIYAWLVETTKKQHVKKLQIVAIIRDWAAREAKIKPEYPQAPVVIVDIPLWPMETRQEFIEDRLSMHADAYYMQVMDDKLPECSPSDMWERPTMYAIKKEGGVKAKKVFATKEEAEEALTPGHFIEERKGERVRCANYCAVSGFCDQYQDYLRTQNVDD